MVKKVFIVLTGIDGSGKTTHAVSLSKELQRETINSIYFRPRGITIIPTFLRGLLKSYPNLSPRNVAMSKKADNFSGRNILRALFLTIPFWIYALIVYYAWIRPLRSKKVVICDRYFFDWFYNLWGNASIALTHLLPKPDIVFLLDVPVNIAFSRMHSIADKQISLSYYESLRCWYLMLAKQQGFFIVDSTGDFKDVKGIIEKLVMRMLRGGS
jgi:thymidylate kinase